MPPNRVKSPTKTTAASSKAAPPQKLPPANLKQPQKSSMTATKMTANAAQPPPPSSVSAPDNAPSGIDEVLSESDQLLRAAAEAQALGRLRTASTYLLLAHARLVGLGRRFDRSRIIRSDGGAIATDNNGNEDTNQSSNAGGGKGGKLNGAIDPLIQGGDQSNLSLPLAAGSHSNAATNDGTKNTADNNTNSEPMLFPHQTSLHHMPDGVAYVEHLARAAMELHHKRTGRGMQHDTMVERQNAASKAKQVEQEQIRLAARGLFATAKGFTGVSVGANENSRDAPPTTRKRKATEAHLDSEEKNALAKRKGGRGKKPPTLVMHTVVGKNYDVHDLMKGGLCD